MFIRHISFLALLLVLAASGVPGALAERKSGEPAESIEKLIEQLGDDNPKVREAATSKLKQRDEALPALKKALNSPDAEVRERAKVIITEIEKRLQARTVQAILDRGLDLYIDELVTHGKEVGAADWPTVVALARTLSGKAGRDPDKGINPFTIDFMEYEVVFTDHWRHAQCTSKRVLTNNVTSETTIGMAVVVCRDTAQFRSAIHNSIVLANGDIKQSELRSALIHDSVVFCDGNIHVGSISESVVIATGSVTTTGRNGPDCIVIQNEPNVRKLFNLFNPAQAGIEVAESKTEVKVERVHDKPFAKARFQKGDVVLAVGDAKISGYDDFRKAVRRNFVDKTEPVFKVKRGEQTLELKVSFKE